MGYHWITPATKPDRLEGRDSQGPRLGGGITAHVRDCEKRMSFHVVQHLDPTLSIETEIDEDIQQAPDNRLNEGYRNGCRQGKFYARAECLLLRFR